MKKGKSQRFKNVLTKALAIFAATTRVMFFPVSVFASGTAGSVDDVTGTSKIQTSGQINDLIKGVVETVFVAGALAAVVYIIIGGYRFVISQGNAQAIDEATKTIIMGVVGLIIILLSAVLARFVIVNVLGMDISIFDISSVF